MGELVDIMGLDILPVFGAKDYLARLRQTLDNPKLVDDGLHWAISSMTKSVMTHPDLLRELVPSGIVGAGLEAINRQALKGTPGNQSVPLYDFLCMYMYESPS